MSDPSATDPVELQTVLDRWRAEAELEQSLRGLEDTVEWVSLAEAEAASGVSRSTLRAWYRGGHVPSRLIPGPHGVQRMVPKHVVIERAERSPGIGRRSEPAGAGGRADGGELDAGGGDPVARRGGGRTDEQMGVDVAESMLKMAQLACEQAEARAAAAEARAAAAEARATEAEARLREALERAAAAEARLGAHADKGA